MRSTRFIGALAAAIFAIALVSSISACAGGGGNPVPTPFPSGYAATPTPTPTATPTAGPTTAPTTAPTATATPTLAPTTAPTATATPTLAPTTAPTATPTGTPTITITVQNNFDAFVFPGSLSAGGCPASDYSVTFVASETGVTSFTAVSSNSSQVAISAGSNAATFVATVPTNNTNFANGSIVVKDPSGNSVTSPVTFNLVCL